MATNLGKFARLYEDLQGVIANYLGCETKELGTEWAGWAFAVAEATTAKGGNFAAIGRLAAVAQTIQRL